MTTTQHTIDALAANIRLQRQALRQAEALLAQLVVEHCGGTLDDKIIRMSELRGKISAIKLHYDNSKQHGKPSLRASKDYVEALLAYREVSTHIELGAIKLVSPKTENDEPTHR